MAKKTYQFSFEEVVFMARLVQFYPMPDTTADEGKAWHKMVLLSGLFKDTVKGVADKNDGEQVIELALFGWAAKSLANMLKEPWAVIGGEGKRLYWPANQAVMVAEMLYNLTGERIGEWADEEDDDEVLPAMLKEHE